MGIAEQLPAREIAFTKQVWIAIAVWLTLTFTLALALTLFVP